MEKLTQKKVKEELALLSISFKATGFGDFRVNHRGGVNGDNEATAYYTDDLQDALDTGKRMHKEAEEKQQKENEEWKKNFDAGWNSVFKQADRHNDN